MDCFKSFQNLEAHLNKKVLGHLCLLSLTCAIQVVKRQIVVFGDDVDIVICDFVVDNSA